MAAIINNKEYGWGEVTIYMLGKIVGGARGISYSVPQEKEHVFGRGDAPRTIGRGNKTPQGSLRLLQSEFDALMDLVEDGQDLGDLEGFNITVSYIPKAGTEIVNDIIKGVEFTDSPKAINQNDKFQEIELPFLALGIDYNTNK